MNFPQAYRLYQLSRHSNSNTWHWQIYLFYFSRDKKEFHDSKDSIVLLPRISFKRLELVIFVVVKIFWVILRWVELAYIVCDVSMLCKRILTLLSPNSYSIGYMFTENKTRMVCYLYGSHKYIGNNIVVLIYCYPGEK